mmetsp:Transcript_136811/g.324169  ORF Transcript_136811/g.324169 Transcript_136811/m.324169 type:complete len:204 (+) Transcript_136811:6320-6931(+)
MPGWCYLQCCERLVLAMPAILECQARGENQSIRGRFRDSAWCGRRGSGGFNGCRSRCSHRDAQGSSNRGGDAQGGSKRGGVTGCGTRCGGTHCGTTEAQGGTGCGTTDAQGGSADDSVSGYVGSGRRHCTHNCSAARSDDTQTSGFAEADDSRTTQASGFARVDYARASHTGQCCNTGDIYDPCSRCCGGSKSRLHRRHSWPI